jgi:hypothetical protein
MPVRTAIITDESWDPTDEEERATAVEQLHRHGIEPTVVYSGRDFSRIPGLNVDLLVVDFGGLAASYGSPVGDYSRSVMAWADEHPSSFVLLWSTMTSDIIASMLRDGMPDGGFDDTKGWWDPVEWPANVRALDTGWAREAYGKVKFGDWRRESWTRAKAWLGL